MGLYVDYSSFLLATRRSLKEAYEYLIQAINEDEVSMLQYGLAELETIPEVLRNKVRKEGDVLLRGIDYAYYLLIHHYEAFEKAGINLGDSRKVYLEDYQKVVKANAGQQGQEKEDEVAYHLLGSLYREMGDEAAAKQAFAQAAQFAPSSDYAAAPAEDVKESRSSPLPNSFTEVEGKTQAQISLDKGDIESLQ
ncbi:MAG: hypothetical protein AAFQ78_02765 [Bacteroidota bacterium]